MIRIVVQCNRILWIALLMISKVMQCIGIALLMISIVVQAYDKQCIGIALLMLKIVVQCNTIKSAMHWN